MTIPEEVYLIVGTLVISRLDLVLKFFRSHVEREVKTATLESTISQIQKDIGKIEQIQNKMQQDLNEFYKRLKGS